MHRPMVSLGIGLAILLAAASPIFGLHIGHSGVSTLPDRLPSKQGYVPLAGNFPVQTPNPVRIVVAVVSVCLSLLSVGAAYGLLTLVFIEEVGGFRWTTRSS